MEPQGSASRPPSLLIVDDDVGFVHAAAELARLVRLRHHGRGRTRPGDASRQATRLRSCARRSRPARRQRPVPARRRRHRTHARDRRDRQAHGRDGAGVRFRNSVVDYLVKPIASRSPARTVRKLREPASRRTAACARAVARHGRRIATRFQAMRRMIEKVAPSDAAVARAWRKRLRQGTRRARDPRSERATRSVRRGELRRGRGRTAREPVVRPRERQLHRRGLAPRGLPRAGRARHAVPRRDHRDGAGAADAPAARARLRLLSPRRRPVRPAGARCASCRRPIAIRSKPSPAAACAKTSITACAVSRFRCPPCANAATMRCCSPTPSSPNSTRAAARAMHSRRRPST